MSNDSNFLNLVICDADLFLLISRTGAATSRKRPAASTERQIGGGPWQGTPSRSDSGRKGDRINERSKDLLLFCFVEISKERQSEWARAFISDWQGYSLKCPDLKVSFRLFMLSKNQGKALPSFYWVVLLVLLLHNCTWGSVPITKWPNRVTYCTKYDICTIGHRTTIHELTWLSVLCQQRKQKMARSEKLESRADTR